MFIGRKFKHQQMRKLTIAFASLFNSIQVDRSDGKVLDVGISFAPKQQFLAKLNANNAAEKVDKVLPKMSFEFGSLDYAEEREADPYSNWAVVDSEDNLRSYTEPVQYTVPIELTIYTKYIDDLYAIIEQIIPFFRPDLTLSIKFVQGIIEDLPLRLTGVGQPESQWEGSFTEKGLFTCDLSFEVEMKFYPYIDNGKRIKRVIVNFSEQEDMSPSERVTQSVNPFDAESDEVYVIDEVWSEHE